MEVHVPTQSSFSRLPDELLLGIVEVSCAHALAVLSRLGDHRVTRIAVAKLYNTVSITREDSLVRFCCTVALERSLALLVETLTMCATRVSIHSPNTHRRRADSAKNASTTIASVDHTLSKSPTTSK